MGARVTTDRLIEHLRDDAGPVRRLRPPLRRAALWLLAIAALAVLAILAFSNLPVFAQRMREPKLQLEMLGTLLTGIVAVVAAFHLSLPDRSSAWALLPLPPLALWLAASSYGCYQDWVRFGPAGAVPGETAHCFVFILGIGVPLSLSLLWLLRRARPLTPVRVAAVGGLGVAAIAAFILQFFHPFDVTLLDLVAHLAAIILVIAIASSIGRFGGNFARR